MTGAAGMQGVRPARAIAPILGVAMLALLGAIFLWRLWMIGRFAGWAVTSPHELDYGEGIVWEQMRRIVAGEGYGQIADLPGIVFHYPPVYHLTSYALAALSGMDQLAAGRAVSLLAIAVVAAIGALLVLRILRPEMNAWTARLGAACAICVLLTCWPVVYWIPVMRVDLLAVAWSFAGLWFAISAVRRPVLVHVAAICFVISLFTKQTMIAAPAACFLLLFLVRPRTAFAGIATATALGLAVLASLQIATDGGFVRHIFGNNLNRFELRRFIGLAVLLLGHGVYILLGILLLRNRLRPSVALFRGGGLAAVRARIVEDPASCAFLFLAANLATATPILLLYGKSGANFNYAIEWFCLLALLAGIGLADMVATFGAAKTAAPRQAGFLILAMAAQVLVLPTKHPEKVLERAPAPEIELLSNLIRASDRQIISDDMVLLLRNGKQTVWEPSIFAELASVGRYDERPFVRAVKAGQFAFFATHGRRGEAVFDSRYTPAVADAMDEAYPVKRELAGLTLHLPARCSAARTTPPCP